MRTLALLIVAAGAFLAAACASGPDYRRPEAPVPAEFKEQEGLSAAGIIEWKPAQPRDEVHRGNWWEIFSDPVLNGLEEQVAISNQNIAQAEAQFRGARAALRGARADFFPTLTAGASVMRSRSSANAVHTPTGISPEATTDFLLHADFAYEADIWGRVRRNVEANAAIAQATAADLEAARLSFQAELAVDYFQARGVDSERRLLDATVDDYERALQLTINRHDQGIASGIDVSQAQAQLEQARAQATELHLTRSQLEHAIAILVGKPPAEFTLEADTASTAPPSIPMLLPSDLLERRPDIAADERRVGAANAEVGVASSAYFPRLLLGASGGYESTRLASFLSFPSWFWSLGPALVQTLFDGGKRRAAVDQALAARDAATAVYRQDVLTALQEVEDSLATLRDLSEESKEQDAAVDAADRALASANNRYNGGVATYLEVITAQTTALADKRAAVEIQARRMAAGVLLVKALGGDWRSSDLPSAQSLVSTQSTSSAPASAAPGEPPSHR